MLRSDSKIVLCFKMSIFRTPCEKSNILKQLSFSNILTKKQLFKVLKLIQLKIHI